MCRHIAQREEPACPLAAPFQLRVKKVQLLVLLVQGSQFKPSVPAPIKI